MKKVILLIGIIIAHNFSYAQCSIGESEVTIDITTDAYGYEIYWELVPNGNSCGVGTIFAGGNTAVGCGGGGAQNQTPGGYANNTTLNEGAWCLLTGTTYDLIFVDDWGDGGESFTINIEGFPIYQWSAGTGAGAGSVYSFVVTPPLAYDMEGEQVTTFNYVNIGNVNISGIVTNKSANTITDFDISYQVNNGAIVSQPLTGLNILPYTDYSFTHSTQWNG